MVDARVAVPRAATSWGAVLGGWVATIGASALFAPVVAGILAAMGSPQGGADVALAFPVVIGLLLSYLVGGYVAGRMAGYRTSWHGLMTAFFSLFIVLLALLVGGLADRGVFAGSGLRSLADVVPGVRDLNIDSFGNAVSFGAILGFLAAIIGGWAGGVLAPSWPSVPASGARRAPAAPVAREPVRTEREAVRERPSPATPAMATAGRKGGEPAEPDRNAK